MRFASVLATALLLGALLPVPAQQDESAVFFSLASNRTFSPEDAPSIQLWAQGVEALQFRVYRVNNPVKFFQELQDPHNFGMSRGGPPRPPAELTPLERFHQFKRSWRFRLRNVFRAQYSSDSRAIIRTSLTSPRMAPVKSGVRTYAEVPVLNPQQLVSTWEQTVPRGNRWDAQTIILQPPGKGVYLVEATDGKLRAYTIVQVSDVVVITKGTSGKIVAQVVNRKTGEPVADCGLLVWSNNKELAREKTDNDGVAEAKFSERQLEHVLVIANKGADFTADAVYGYALGSNPEREWMGYVYTDRPVYRPGHAVKFRGILRVQSGGGYRIPQVREVGMEVHDSEGKPVLRKTVAVSALGTVNGDFTLAGSAALGYYGIEFRSGEARVGGGFQVEEYKRPEYEVKVTPEKRRVVQGEPIVATIDARYYFGEPVARAKVTWVVHRSRYWYPLYTEDMDEEQAGGDEGGGYGDEQILEQSGELNEDGKLQISVLTQAAQFDQRYRIEARVMDQANREISGAAAAIATVGTFVVHIEPEQYVYSPGEQAAFLIEARDYDGNPVQTDYDVSLREWQWNRGGGRLINSVTGRTDAQGKAQFETKVPNGGSYVARVTAVTTNQREIADEAYLWVSGGGDSAWYSERRERLQIVPDKKSYKAGETARVLLITGAPKAWVLVTMEGKDLYRSQVVKAEGPTVTVEVPIKTEHEPNLFLGASFVKDGQLYQGAKSIKVPPVDHELTVELKSSKPQYKPGEQATFTIDARDNNGKPAAAAEFSLGVVDEAIYAIRREMAQDILNFFYGRGWNRVMTSTSLSYYFQGEAGKRQMQLARVRKNALAQLKPERLVQPEIRKAFPDTAFWTASLRTDAGGRAQAQVQFPDALTTWRATARGVTRDTSVGSAVYRVIVRKNLILRLSTPRFLRDGDEVTVSALVHNYLADAKTARVSLEAQGADIVEGGTKDVEVPSKGEARVDYRLRAKPGEKVVLLGKALTDEESDALELTLPLVPFGLKLSEARAGSITAQSGTATASVPFPAESKPWSRQLEIRVTPSIAGAIFGALDYLTSYPYGCVEQTMSSFLPNVIVSKVSKELGLKTNIDEGALRRKIQAGLERLYDFQHEDGGWGWWKTDESHPFMTPYVVSGLLQARAAGVNLREDSIQRGTQWLKSAYGAEKADAELRAYMLYALSQERAADKAALDRMWPSRGSLSAYGVALYGLALQGSGDGRANEIAAELEGLVKSNEQEAWWPAERDRLLDFSVDATPEATAYAMKFLTAARPQSPLLAKAAAWLVNHRGGGYYWNTTKQTAMVIYGTTDYLRLGDELTPDFAATVTVNGKQVLSKRFTREDALSPSPTVVRVPAEEVVSGRGEIQVTKNGQGRLYWSANESYYTTAERVTRPSGASLGLRREYYRLAPATQGDHMVYRLEPLSGTVAPGDVLAVRLTLDGNRSGYVMIEDPIPAGAEFIERDDLYPLSDRPSWWGTWGTRREFHDDHVSLFQTYFDGQQQYTYLLKAVNPGRFGVSPGKVQPMYQPDTFSTTASRTLEVR